MNPVLERINLRNRNFRACAEYSGTASFSLELRKKKRMEKVLEKRFKIQESRDVEFDSACFERFNDVLARDDLQEILKVLKQLRVISVNKEKLDYQSLVVSDLVGKVMMVLQEDWPLNIIEEASLVLANLSCGPTVICEYMIHRGITEVMTQIIGKNSEISENAIWTIANLACEGLLKYLDQFSEFLIEFAKIVLWACFNLIKGLPRLTDDLIQFFSKVLCIFKSCCQFEGADVHWLKLVSQFAKYSDITGDLIIENHYSKILLDFLASSQDKIVIGLTLTAIGNILFNSLKNTQILISFHLIDRIYSLLRSEFFENHFQVYWVLSNIAAGTPAQAHQLITHSVCFESFNGFLHPDPQVVLEVSHLFHNLSLKSTESDLIEITEKGLVDVFSTVLEQCTKDSLFNIIRSSINILCALHESGRRDLFERIDRLEYWSRLESFETSDHPGISTMAKLVTQKLRIFRN